MQNIVPLKKRIDLIILMGVTSSANIIQESYSTQIPTISCDSFTKSLNTTYEVANSLKFMDKQKNNNFICSMILATITKSKDSINKNKPKFHKIKKLF